MTDKIKSVLPSRNNCEAANMVNEDIHFRLIIYKIKPLYQGHLYKTDQQTRVLIFRSAGLAAWRHARSYVAWYCWLGWPHVDLPDGTSKFKIDWMVYSFGNNVFHQFSIDYTGRIITKSVAIIANQQSIKFNGYRCTGSSCTSPLFPHM